jgi:hypothetical protein
MNPGEYYSRVTDRNKKQLLFAGCLVVIFGPRRLRNSLCISGER